MHGVMITATTELTKEQFEKIADAKAEQFRGTPGLILKTYVWEGNTMGGFHVFSDRASADGYLSSPAFQDVQKNPKFSSWQVCHYDVLKQASVLNNTPVEPITA